jgi:hypothetical protein
MVLRKSAHNFKDRKMAKRQFEAIVPAEAGWIVISIDTSAKDDIKTWSITERFNVIGFGVRADDGYPVPITAIGPLALCNMDDGGDKANDCYTGFFLQAPNGWITGARSGDEMAGSRQPVQSGCPRLYRHGTYRTGRTGRLRRTSAAPRPAAHSGFVVALQDCRGRGERRS